MRFARLAATRLRRLLDPEREDWTDPESCNQLAKRAIVAVVL